MRKNYTRILAAVAASSAVLSCMRDNLVEEPLDILPTQYVATFESTEGDDDTSLETESPETKVSLASDNTTVKWDKGDEVVFISSEGELVSTWHAGTIDQNGKRAIFDLYSGSADAPAKFAVYPKKGLASNDGSYYVNGQTIECVVSEKQSGLYKDADIMVTQIRNNNNSLKFRHMNGIFELKVTDSKVKKIVIEDSNWKIAGGIHATFDNYGDGGLQELKSKDLDSKMITVENVTPGTWYVAVRPGTYDAGTITISYLDEKNATVSSIKYPNLLTVYRKDIIAFGDISKHTSMSGTMPAGRTFNNYMKQLAGELKNITKIDFIPNGAAGGGTQIAEDVYMYYSGGVITVRTSIPLFTANKDCSSMFDGCYNVTSIRGLSYVNTSATTDMSYMFEQCMSLTSVELDGYFTTANVTNMCDMFWDCEKLEELDLSTWNTRKVTNMGYMFEWNWALEKVILGRNFVIPDGCFADEMLLGCSATWYGTTEEMESFQKNLVLGNDFYDGYVNFAIDMGNAGWWSAWNAGANKPTEFGYYFSWGNDKGHIRNGVADGYRFDDITYKSTDGYSMTTDWQIAPYCDSQFRMPGTYDFENLVNNSNMTATTVNGVSGYKFTHKSNGNSIFIPDAGFYADSPHYLLPEYWTSSNNSAETAKTFWLKGNESESRPKYYGCPVRPIAKMGDVAVTGVSIDQTVLKVNFPGDKDQLTASVSPYNATNKHVTWSSSNTSVATVSSDGLVTAVSDGTARITVTTVDGSKTASFTVIVQSCLPGVFSVSATKKVRFAPGNLQATYDGSKYNWGFAKNQYDYVGKAPGNTTINSQTKGEVVDLFGWSTDKYYGISIKLEYYYYSGDFFDWGKSIGDGNTWRTPSLDEMLYIFKTRDNASRLRKCGVTVCGKENCCIIAPDGFKGTIADSYDASTWPAAEASGLVCFPAVGYRSQSTVSDVGESGHYWLSSSRNYDTADVVVYYSDKINSGDIGRSCGSSVRLVTDFEE